MEPKPTEQKQSLEEFHPARIDLHAKRILQEKNYMTAEDPRGYVEIIREVGLEALLLAALALEKEE